MRISLPILFILVSLQLNSQSIDRDSFVEEAYYAFLYLNDIRSNPVLYSQEIGIDLSELEKAPPLRWNIKLAKSAQKKAEDMAKRDYLDHFSPEGLSPADFAFNEGYYLPLSWPDVETNNYTESISAGSSLSGMEHIVNLIYDKGYPHSSSKANHRKHLLAMNAFWKTHVDVGIGFAYNENSKYKGYFVVHTGIEGEQYVMLTGKIILPRKKKTQAFDLWVGAIDKHDKKYWTKVHVPKGAGYAAYSIRIPVESEIVVRYYKEEANKRFVRAYYHSKKTVSTLKEAEWIVVKKENVSGIDLAFQEFE